jgi:putative spermidine/putrescine transport system permease protein
MSFGDRWFFPELLPEAWSAAAWMDLVGGRGRLARAARNSVGLAAGTGLAAAGLALFVGRALASLTGWRRHLGAAAAFLPVAAPPIAVAVGLQYSFLRAGLGGSGVGVLLAHLVPALGYASLFFLGVFSAYDGRPEEEARTLGAAPRQVLMLVTLPRLRRPLLEAFALGFLVSWAQVPLTLLVGQGVVSTLAVEVFASLDAGQDALAAMGGLLLSLPPMGLLAVVAIGTRRTSAVVA